MYGVLGAEKWVHDRAGLLITCSLTVREVAIFEKSFIDTSRLRAVCEFMTRSNWKYL